MRYADLMKDLGVRTYKAVIDNVPDELFAVLDDLKGSVEQHDFEDMQGLSAVLRNYPHTDFTDVMSVRAEPHQRGCFSPLATEFVVIGQHEVQVQLERLVLHARDGFWFPHGENGNRYRFDIEHYTNCSYAHLSVMHKDFPPEVKELLRNPQQLRQRMDEIERQLREMEDRVARAFAGSSQNPSP